MTQGIDDYNLPIPYFQFHKMVWDWRYDKFEDCGIRIKAAAILKKDLTYILPRLLSTNFLPLNHQQCRNALGKILLGRSEQISEQEEKFLKEHWRGELLPHMLTKIKGQSVSESLRNGSGLILALILKKMPYKELTRSYGAYGITGYPVVSRSIREVDVLFDPFPYELYDDPYEGGDPYSGTTSSPSWVQSGSSSNASSDCVSS